MDITADITQATLTSAPRPPSSRTGRRAPAVATGARLPPRSLRCGGFSIIG